jgi:hypothetical protein
MTPTKALRCAQALQKVSWRVFVKPEDGRQGRHLGQQRAALVNKLALSANPDGTNIKLSVFTMASALGCVRQTIYDLLADLTAMGFLVEKELVWVHGKQVRLRALNLPKILSGAGLPLPKPPQPATSESQQPLSPVQSSQAPRPVFAGDPSILQSSPCVHSSFETQPGALPQIQPHTHTERERENLNTFAQVSRYLPTDMLASQWKRGEKEQVDVLIAKHGGEKFIATQLLYWREQDPTQFARTLFRWTALLNSFDGFLGKVTSELLSELSWERWKKESPEEYKRQQDASIARQTAELTARWQVPPRNELTPEEFLAEETVDDLLADDPTPTPAKPLTK